MCLPVSYLFENEVYCERKESFPIGASYFIDLIGKGDKKKITVELLSMNVYPRINKNKNLQLP